MNTGHGPMSMPEKLGRLEREHLALPASGVLRGGGGLCLTRSEILWTQKGV